MTWYLKNVHSDGRVHKFGEQTLVGTASVPTDIWTGGSTSAPENFPFLSSASALQVATASTNDHSAGVGARTIRVEGLDGSWNEQSEDVTISGSTAVDLANTYVRVHRAYVLTAGATGTNSGIINIQTTDATLRACIPAGDGQTQMAVWTVPNDYSHAQLICVTAGVSKKQDATAEIQIRVRTNADTTDAAWRVLESFAVGRKPDTILYSVARTLSPKTDIKMTVRDISANSGVFGMFEVVMV